MSPPGQVARRAGSHALPASIVYYLLPTPLYPFSVRGSTVLDGSFSGTIISNDIGEAVRVQGIVRTFPRVQLRMGSLFNHSSSIKHVDHVGVFHRGYSVSDCNDRATLHQAGKRQLDEAF